MELRRALNPRNAGMGSVMIAIADSGETFPSFARNPFLIPMVSPTSGRYVLARCRLCYTLVICPFQHRQVFVSPALSLLRVSRRLRQNRLVWGSICPLKIKSGGLLGSKEVLLPVTSVPRACFLCRLRNCSVENVKIWSL